jgi:hypothetical protein
VTGSVVVRCVTTGLAVVVGPLDPHPANASATKAVATRVRIAATLANRLGMGTACVRWLAVGSGHRGVRRGPLEVRDALEMHRVKSSTGRSSDDREG